jgi:hypothetical protein
MPTADLLSLTPLPSGGHSAVRMGNQMEGLIFWQHDVDQVVGNAAWTPVAFNTVRTNLGGAKPWSRLFPNTDLVPNILWATTTVAAGSDGQVLPQGTINVASTAANATTGTPAFRSLGYIVHRKAGVDSVIPYTGLTGTTFTGCTLGAGRTLNTGDTIRQANVMIHKADLCANLVGQIAWASNATGVRGLRMRQIDGFLNWTAAFDSKAAVATADPLLTNTIAEQPVSGLAADADNLGVILECFQSSTGPLNLAAFQFGSPRIVAYNFATEISGV